MAESYLINLSFQAKSGDDANAVRSKIEQVARKLEDAQQVLGLKVALVRDWMAVPDRTGLAPLRPAANRQITTGPPEDEDD